MPEGGSGVPAGSPSDPLSPRCCCSGAARVPLALLPACAPAWLLQPLATCREPSSSSGGRRNESHEGPWGALGSVTLSTHLPRFCLTQPQLLPEVLPGTHRAPQGGVPSPVPPPKTQLPLLPGLQEQRCPAGVAPSCLGVAAEPQPYPRGQAVQQGAAPQFSVSTSPPPKGWGDSPGKGQSPPRG